MIIKVGGLEPLGPIGVYAYGCGQVLYDEPSLNSSQTAPCISTVVSRTRAASGQQDSRAPDMHEVH